MSMNSSELRVLVRASDFDTSVHFYQELLGMERLKSWARDTGSGVILRAGPGRTIELLGAPPGKDYADRVSRGVALWMQVDGVAAGPATLSLWANLERQLRRVKARHPAAMYRLR